MPDCRSLTTPLTVTVTSAPSGGHSSAGVTVLVIVGATLSTVTVTVKALVAMFGVGAAPSLAVQVTVVTPAEKALPEAGEQVTAVGPEIRSTAVGSEYVTTALGKPNTAMFAGVPEITGGVVSRTVTVKDAVPVLDPSDAVHVTVVAPRGNVDPEAGEHVGAIEPATMSVAEDENDTTAPAALVAPVTMFAGTVTTGATVSLTMTSKVPLASLPEESSASQVTGVVPTGNVDPVGGCCRSRSPTRRSRHSRSRCR